MSELSCYLPFLVNFISCTFGMVSDIMVCFDGTGQVMEGVVYGS